VSEVARFARLDELAAPGASGLPSLDERSDPPPSKLVKMTMGVLSCPKDSLFAGKSSGAGGMSFKDGEE
jgi:hypothetical protein